MPVVFIPSTLTLISSTLPVTLLNLKYEVLPKADDPKKHCSLTKVLVHNGDG